MPLRPHSHISDLLSDDLKVPQHGPTNHQPQPCEPVQDKHNPCSNDGKHKSAPVSMLQIDPVDSVHKSVRSDESKTQTLPLQPSLSVTPHNSAEMRTDLLVEKNSGLGKSRSPECEKQGRAVDHTTGNTGPKLSTTPSLGNSIAKIEETKAGPSKQVPTQKTASQAMCNHQVFSPEESFAQQLSNQSEKPPDELQISHSLPFVIDTNTSRQPYLKLFFWRRYKTSKSKHTFKGKGPAAGIQPNGISVGALDICVSQPLPTMNESSNKERVSKAKKLVSGMQKLGDTTSTTVAPSAHQSAIPGKTCAFDKTNENPSSLSSLSMYTITVPVSSPSMYLLEKDTYIGKLKDLAPPVEAEGIWLSTIRTRLIMDLKPILASLPKSLSIDETVIEPELCMSGHTDQGASDFVHLTPSIWIRCGSKRCKEDIRTAVADLSYVRSIPVHFRLDAPRIACHLSRCAAVIVRQAAEAPSPTHSGGLSTEQIVGIVIGSVFGALFLIILGCACCCSCTDDDGCCDCCCGCFDWCWGGCVRLLVTRPRSKTNHLVAPTLPSILEAEMRHTNLNPFFSETVIPEVRGQDPLQGLGRQENDARPELESLSALMTEILLSCTSIDPASKATNMQGEYSSISACGLQVEFEIWDNDVKRAAASTIGGLIRMDGTLYGLTTAHSIMELLPYHRTENLENLQVALKVCKYH